ncbi:MAG: NAD-dependent epimerase/dehydratase family protein, partial [Planctomycetes bacterium]|nr:NAD-dependent epimerase/dehydratase family protein [Planctomycetota bacterium]
MILVTVGGGFLGGAIVRKLLDRGDRVRVIGRRRYPWLEALGVDCLQGDIADPAACRQAVSGCAGVIHTAAIPGVWGEYAVYYNANFLGTKNLLDAVRAEGLTRFLYTSTPSVVHGGHGISGGDETLPYPDDYLPRDAATKALAEK